MPLTLLASDPYGSPMRRRIVRTPGSNAPPSGPAALPAWHDDPVGQRFMAAIPSARVQLKHKTFDEALLYREADGGAIVLKDADNRVLALDYDETGELDYQWSETLRHYARLS